jgi:hypothetical protein
MLEWPHAELAARQESTGAPRVYPLGAEPRSPRGSTTTALASPSYSAPSASWAVQPALASALIAVASASRPATQTCRFPLPPCSS